MPVPDTLTQNVRYWTMILKALESLAPSATVASHQTLELGDEFFESPEASDARWFLLDPAHYDLFLDDGVGTVHLANLSGKVQYLNDDTRLVTWYGHDPERYRILLNSPGGAHPASPMHRGQDVLWFAWDTRSWTLYAHDGKLLIPVFNPAEIAAALGFDPDARIWMGWNGRSVDVFSVSAEHLPDDLVAVFVARDLSVATVHRSRP